MEEKYISFLFVPITPAFTSAGPFVSTHITVHISDQLLGKEDTFSFLLSVISKKFRHTYFFVTWSIHRQIGKLVGQEGAML